MIDEEPKYDRVVAYVRKSSEDNEKGEANKQVNSFEYQRNFIEEAKTKYKLTLVHDKFEDDQSGYKAFERQGFNEMLDFLRDHKDEVDGIVCTEISRLARNFADGGMILWYMQSDIIKRIYTPSKIFTNSSSDQMMVAIEFAMSKKSSDDTGYRTKEGMKAKAYTIKHPPQAPILGYKGEGATGKRKWMVDEITAPLVRKVFEQFATGEYTLKEIADYAYDIGLRSPKNGTGKIAHTTWMGRLREEKYTGIFYYKDERIVGDYIGIIDVDLFYEVKNVLFDKRHEKNTSIDYAYTGLIKCEHCGGLLSGNEKKGIIYYRCSKRKLPCKGMQKISYVPEKTLESEILRILSQIEINSETLQLCKDYIIELCKPEQIKIKEQIRRFNEYIETENQEQIKFGRKDLPKSDYNRLMEDSRKKVLSFERSIRKLKEIEDELNKLLLNFVNSIHDITKKWDVILPENKKAILTVFCENLLWKDGKLEWLWKKPYYLFAKREKCSDVLPRVDSNHGHFA